MADINLLKSFMPEMAEKTEQKNPLMTTESSKDISTLGKFFISTQNISPSLLKYLILNTDKMMEGQTTQMDNQNNTNVVLKNASEQINIKTNIVLPEKTKLHFKLELQSNVTNEKIPLSKDLISKNPETILKEDHFSGKIIKINNTPLEKYISENSDIKNTSKLSTPDFELISNTKKTPIRVEIITALPKTSQPNQSGFVTPVSRETNNYQNINFSAGESVVVKITNIKPNQQPIPQMPATDNQPTQSAQQIKNISNPNQLTQTNNVKGEVLPIKIENSPVIQVSKDVFMVFPKDIKLPQNSEISMEIIKKIPIETKNINSEKWTSIKELSDFFKIDLSEFNSRSDSIEREKTFTQIPVQENKIPQNKKTLSNLPAPLKNDNSFMGNLFKMFSKIPLKNVFEIFPQEELNILKETQQGETILKNISQDISESVKLKTDSEGNNWRETSIPIINDSISNLSLIIKEDSKEGKKSKQELKEKIRFVVECEFSEMGFIQFDGFANRKEKSFKLILRTESNFSSQFANDIENIFYSVLSQTKYSGQIKIDKTSRLIEFYEKISLNGKGVIA